MTRPRRHRWTGRPVSRSSTSYNCKKTKRHRPNRKQKKRKSKLNPRPKAKNFRRGLIAKKRRRFRLKPKRKKNSKPRPRLGKKKKYRHRRKPRKRKFRPKRKRFRREPLRRPQPKLPASGAPNEWRSFSGGSVPRGDWATPCPRRPAAACKTGSARTSRASASTRTRWQ